MRSRRAGANRGRNPETGELVVGATQNKAQRCCPVRQTSARALRGLGFNFAGDDGTDAVNALGPAPTPASPQGQVADVHNTQGLAELLVARSVVETALVQNPTSQ